MRLTMLCTVLASADPSGIRTIKYEEGRSYDVYTHLADIFLTERWARPEEPHAALEVKPLAVPEKKRGRPRKGA